MCPGASEAEADGCLVEGDDGIPILRVVAFQRARRESIAAGLGLAIGSIRRPRTPLSSGTGSPPAWLNAKIRPNRLSSVCGPVGKRRRRGASGVAGIQCGPAKVGSERAMDRLPRQSSPSGRRLPNRRPSPRLLPRCWRHRREFVPPGLDGAPCPALSHCDMRVVPHPTARARLPLSRGQRQRSRRLLVAARPRPRSRRAATIRARSAGALCLKQRAAQPLRCLRRSPCVVATARPARSALRHRSFGAGSRLRRRSHVADRSCPTAWDEQRRSDGGDGRGEIVRHTPARVFRSAAVQAPPAPASRPAGGRRTRPRSRIDRGWRRDRLDHAAAPAAVRPRRAGPRRSNRDRAGRASRVASIAQTLATTPKKKPTAAAD